MDNGWKVCKYQLPYDWKYNHNRDVCIFVAQSLTCRKIDGWSVDSNFLLDGKIAPKTYCECSMPIAGRTLRTYGYYITLTHSSGAHFAFGTNFGNPDYYYYELPIYGRVKSTNNSSGNLNYAPLCHAFSKPDSIYAGGEESNYGNALPMWCAYSPKGVETPFNDKFGTPTGTGIFDLHQLFNESVQDNIKIIPLEYMDSNYEYIYSNFYRISRCNTKSNARWYKSDTSSSDDQSFFLENTNQIVMLVNDEKIFIINIPQYENYPYYYMSAGNFLINNSLEKTCVIAGSNFFPTDTSKNYNWFSDNIYFNGNNYASTPSYTSASTSTFLYYWDEPEKINIRPIGVTVNHLDFFRIKDSTGSFENWKNSVEVLIKPSALSFNPNKTYDLKVRVKDHILDFNQIKFSTVYRTFEEVNGSYSTFYGFFLRIGKETFSITNLSSKKFTITIKEDLKALPTRKFVLVYIYSNYKYSFDVDFSTSDSVTINDSSAYLTYADHFDLFYKIESQDMAYSSFKISSNTYYRDIMFSPDAGTALNGDICIRKGDTDFIHNLKAARVYNFIFPTEYETPLAPEDIEVISLVGTTTLRQPLYGDRSISGTGTYLYADTSQLNLKNIRYMPDTPFPWSKVFVGYNALSNEKESVPVGELSPNVFRQTIANNACSKFGVFFENKKFISMGRGVLFPWDGKSDIRNFETTPINSTNMNE